MADVSSGIRATGEDSGYVRPRIVLKEGNFRVWETVTKFTLRSSKVWKHVDGTAIRPPPARQLRVRLRAVPASPGADARDEVQAITQEMVNADEKRIEDFDAAEAKATSLIMQTLQEKDIMATILLESAKEKWEKLAADYATVSVAMAATARAKFSNFRIREGDSVVEIQHLFDGAVNECALQAVIVTEAEKTQVLMTNCSQKWINFMDGYSNRDPLPDVVEIFRAMKSQEERWTMRNEREYAEANFAGQLGGSSQPWKARIGGSPRERPNGGESKICYCCGKAGHFKRECNFRDKSCNTCKEKGHLANMCRRGGDSSEGGGNGEQETPSPPTQPKPKLVSFAKGTKKEQAKAEGMMVQEDGTITPYVGGFRRGVEWLADSGASRHVCNNLHLMWDVVVKRDPIVLKQLSGEMKVYVTGKVKVRCVDKEGRPVKLRLYEAVYIPGAETNLFSLQKMRRSSYKVIQPQKIGTSWIQSQEDKIVGSLEEDQMGRAVLNCATLLPPHFRTDTYNSKVEVQPDRGEKGKLNVVKWYYRLKKQGIHMGRLPGETLVETSNSEPEERFEEDWVDSDSEDMGSDKSSESVNENMIEEVMVDVAVAGGAVRGVPPPAPPLAAEIPEVPRVNTEERAVVPAGAGSGAAEGDGSGGDPPPSSPICRVPRQQLPRQQLTRASVRSGRGVPALRFDDLFEARLHVSNIVQVTAEEEGEKKEEVEADHEPPTQRRGAMVTERPMVLALAAVRVAVAPVAVMDETMFQFASAGFGLPTSPPIHADEIVDFLPMEGMGG